MSVDERTVEQRLQLLETELEAVRGELNRTRTRLRRLLCGVGLLASAVVFGFTLAPGTEAQGGGQTVQAPFVVVDRTGRTIVRIQSELQNRGVFVHNSSGHVVSEVSVTGATGHGKVVARGSGSGSEVAGIAFDAAGKVSIGARRANGQLFFGVDGDNGLSVYNQQGKAVVHLGYGLAGGGLFQLGNSSGASTVEAGTLQDGKGIVRVYPISTRSPIPIPTFIRGASQ